MIMLARLSCIAGRTIRCSSSRFWPCASRALSHRASLDTVAAGAGDRRLSTSETSPQHVLVVGCGLFGKLIAENIIRLRSNTRVTLTSRAEAKARAAAVEVQCDAATLDLQALKTKESDTLLQSADVVINTAGPWTEDSFELARSACQKGAHYVDISDNRSFCGQFCEQVGSVAAKNGLYAVTGASTCPAVSLAVVRRAVQAVKEYVGASSSTAASSVNIKSVRVVVSGALRTRFGPGTIQSVLSYAGKTFHHRQCMQDDAPSVGWRSPSFETIRGVPERRLVANVETPDLDLVLKEHGDSLESIRVLAGVGCLFPTLGVTLASFLPRTVLERLLLSNAASSTMSNVFDRVCRYLPSGGVNDVGAMKVSCIVAAPAKGTDRSDALEPYVYEWSLLGSDGEGIQIPASPASLLACKLLDGRMEDVKPGAYTPATPLLSLEELEDWWQLEYKKIRTHEHVRPFVSPFVHAIGSRDAQRISPPLRRAHATGSYYEGELEVIGPKGWKQWPLWLLCRYAALPPSTQGKRVPVTVAIEPRPSCNGSGVDEIWFVRSFNARPFVSRWRMSNGVALEQFRFDQLFAMAVVLYPPDGFDLVGRALFPLPLQRLGGPFRMSVHSRSTVNKDDPLLEYLDVEATFPLFGSTTTPFFGYRGDLRIIRTWFG